jgi:hypothetical protein
VIYTKTFLIQTVDGMIVHDFSFALIEAIKYHNWYYDEAVYNYILSETTNRPKLNPAQYYPLEEIIPIGSVKFVLEYLKKYYNIDNIKPLNIPEELMKPEYLKRWVKIHKSETNVINAGDTPIFVKDNTKIKGWTNIVKPNRGYPSGEYLISEVVNIDSEWRAFIFNNELVGLQNYSGDFTIFPDVELIRQMIKDFKTSPKAYTLDVGINEKGTFIVECHDMFSTGLYGFADYKLLPKMFISTWNKLTNNNL